MLQCGALRFTIPVGNYQDQARCSAMMHTERNTNYRTMKIYKTFDEDDDIVAFFLGIILVLVLRSKHRPQATGSNH